MRLVTITVGTNKITVPFRKNQPISVYVHPKHGVGLTCRNNGANYIVVQEKPRG